MALRSFLRHNGYNSLPKTRLEYVPLTWHRGYRREEIHRLLGCLRQKSHQLFVVMAAESGLRSHVLMQLKYLHVMEDLQSGTIPLAVRLEPTFYTGKKAAGYTFLGEGSVRLIRECLSEGLITDSPESKLIPRSYYSIYAAIHRANRRMGLDLRVQACHGFRKYFENALDEANIDHERKMVIEGHFAGTRAKHYTDRDLESLREVYRKAYPIVKLNINETAWLRPDNRRLEERLISLEAQISRQGVLEARLRVLEAELERMKKFRDP